MHVETEGVAHADAAAFVWEKAAVSESEAVPLALAVPPPADAEAGAVALVPLLPVAEGHCESVPVAHAVVHTLLLPGALPDTDFPLLGDTRALTVTGPDTDGDNEEEEQAEYVAEPLPAALHDADRDGVTLPVGPADGDTDGEELSELTALGEAHAEGDTVTVAEALTVGVPLAHPESLLDASAEGEGRPVPHAETLALCVALPVPDPAAIEGLPLTDGEALWLLLALPQVDVVDEREGVAESVTLTEVRPEALVERHREGEGVPLPEGDSRTVLEERPEGVSLLEGHGETVAQLLAEALWEPVRLEEGLVERVAVSKALPEKEGDKEPLRLADSLTLTEPHPLPLRDSVALAVALPDALLWPLAHAVVVPVMLAHGLPDGVEDAERLPDSEDEGVEDAQGEGVTVALRHCEGVAMPVVDVVALAHIVAVTDSVAKPLLVAVTVPLPLPLPHADGVVVPHCEGLPVHEGDTEELLDATSDNVAPPLEDPLREPPLPLDISDAEGAAVAVAQRLGVRLPLAHFEAEPLLLGEREAAAHEDGRAEREGCDALADAVEDKDREGEREEEAHGVPLLERKEEREGDAHAEPLLERGGERVGDAHAVPLRVPEAHAEPLAERDGERDGDAQAVPLADGVAERDKDAQGEPLTDFGGERLTEALLVAEGDGRAEALSAALREGRGE